MSNWCTNTILISGPIEDVSALYKSLKEYDAEVNSKEKDPDDNLINIGAWIKDKFSDKLPEFTEEDYKLSYSNFITEYYMYIKDNGEALLCIYSRSELVSRMYALIKLIEVGFPKCIIHYLSLEPGMDYFINTDESGYYFPERWYYRNRRKTDYYCMSDEDMYKTLRYDYVDIIKDNNIVAPALVNPEVSQIHELVNSLSEYDEDLYVYPFPIGPEYDDKKVEILKGITGKAAE